MAEITPIISSPTVIGVSKVKPDEARKNRPQQPQPPKNDETEQTESGEQQPDNQPSQHIDERV